MVQQLRIATILFVLLSLLTGLAYPLLVTTIANFIFPWQAQGSLLFDRTGQAVGSALIGQAFSDPKYFWSRPSATSPYPYNATASAGSNLGPSNPTLLTAVRSRIEALRAADPEAKTPIPVDLVTASGSGLDPHISPAAADYQVNRVAKLRGLSTARLQDLVATYTEPRQWGVLGEARVNVLALNLALDALKTAKEQ